MAKPRRTSNDRKIPVEDLGKRPTRSGSEVLRALSSTSPSPETPRRTADTRGSKGLLSSIFRDSKGRPIDMTRLDRGRKQKFPIVLLVLGILVAAAVVGALTLNRPGRFANAAVGVTLTMPQTVTSGASFEFTVTIRNDEPVALKTTELTVQYPTGFTFASATPNPTNDANQAWDLGTIASGSERTVTVHGVVLGSVGDAPTFVATASYVPANFSSEFTTVKSAAITVTASRLQIAVDAPAAVAPEKNFTTTVTVTNTAKESLSPVVLTAELPDSFTLDSADPKATEPQRWALGKLDAGAKVSVKVVGSLKGEPGGSAQLTWRVALIEDGSETPQTETHQILTFVKPTVALSVAVNGSTTDGTMKPGDRLAIRIAFTNDSEVNLEDATLTASVDGRGIEWSSLQDPAKGKRSGSTLTWTQSQIPALKNLKPGDAGEVNITLGTQSPLNVQTASDREAFVRVSSTLAPAKGESTAAPPVTRRYVTKAALSSEARFTSEDGETVGEGPLPPTVGSTTLYRIFWTLSNSTNDVRDLTMVAQLPEGVDFEGRNVLADSGQLTYDPATRTVRWTLPKLLAGAGTLVANASAAFSVRITPTSDQVGTSPVLVGAVTLTGTDEFASVPVAATAGAVTTASNNDPSMAGKGTVTS